jgi:hypothetical protein
MSKNDPARLLSAAPDHSGNGIKKNGIPPSIFYARITAKNVRRFDWDFLDPERKFPNLVHFLL